MKVLTPEERRAFFGRIYDNAIPRTYNKFAKLSVEQQNTTERFAMDLITTVQSLDPFGPCFDAEPTESFEEAEYAEDTCVVAEPPDEQAFCHRFLMESLDVTTNYLEEAVLNRDRVATDDYIQAYRRLVKGVREYTDITFAPIILGDN